MKERGQPRSTTLSPAMIQYVEGTAKILGVSVSSALSKIVEEHFEYFAKSIKEGRNGKTKGKNKKV